MITLVAAIGCASRASVLPLECVNPDAQLNAWLDRLEAARTDGCTEHSYNPSPCAAPVREIERLALMCPSHAPTLMANAVIAYDAGNTARAQQLLDQLFEHTQSLPAAAVLRSQIAIQDGNLQFAHRLLQQQIRLAPDNGALREAYGAALYLNGDLVTARQELTTAARRGAPRWRIAYHLGLIDEAENDFDSAKQHYREALDGNPDWAPARMRLNALE